MNYTIKNIPQKLFGKLRKEAEQNRRSINGEIISILEASLTPRLFDPDEILAGAKESRKRTRGVLLDQDLIDRAKREGRP
ncbi:MAG: hypothetical protein A2Y86_08860 [Candidatus Aminicenantes bacterium RBG_13_62_12]|nr:MAG: hypothetical protein A2Y86_08860 [Candidatus Aminicenantes bacterium RBG_13_62_12]